jgi:aminopeptidase N
MSELQRKYLSDYQSSNFLIERVELTVRLHPTVTQVSSVLTIRATHDDDSQVLSLQGEDLNLISISVNGQRLSESDYVLTEEALLLTLSGSESRVEIQTEVNPQANSRLEGLYLSDGVFCTQCEAEGFRRITYYLDRPDVMAVYSTRIESPLSLAPVLLSNGNLVESGNLSDGWHYAVWHDPFPKPSYLFALVAGDLVCQQRPFVTAEGKAVSLEVYVKQHHASRCEHALVSLENAMRWDEQTFGRCYDLDRYMIVAVDDFNMGAMENKGLNVFNARFVLADPQTATDTDYINIDSVIAHEYFHNWTGNRITCRDWFQLTLKEGLTVYRDQLYTEQTLLGKVKRIEDVRGLRSIQFAEDASPLRHPIQPSSYVEMNNFYTATVYEKGAEVVRIYESLLGKAGFRKGMDLYFDRHDGQAVRVEEFRQAMADANGVDLSQMHAWYTQAGTPTLSVVSEWHAATQTLQLKVTQSLPEVVNFQPLLIPLSMAIFNESGCRQSVVLQQGKGDWQGSEGMIWLTQAEETLVFTQVAELPRLSLLRNFSAPVILQMERRLDDWLWQAAHDDDLFNRWEAWQQVWVSLILSGQQALAQGREISLPSTLLPILKAMLLNDELPAAWLAEALRLPSFDYLAQQVSPLSPQSIWDATQQLKRWLAHELGDVMWQVLEERLATIQQFAFSADVIANRSWCHLLLSYLASVDDERAFAWAYDQVVLANNMTNSQAALTLLVHHQAPQAQDALVQFYQRWQGVGLVLDKWFSVQAGNPQASIEQVESLCLHERFVRTTPNRVRSVLGVFGRANPRVFHQADGAGYRLLVEQVAEIDAINPQIAARLIQAFNAWQKLVPTQQALAGAALASLSARAHLSKDLREVLGNLGHATV